MPDRGSKPVIFTAFANDRVDGVRYLRNLPEESRRLREQLETAEREGLCELVMPQNSTPNAILDVFLNPQFHRRIAIFHFAGHANGYQLLLETAAGGGATAHAGGLSALLGQQAQQGELALDLRAFHSTPRGTADEHAMADTVEVYSPLSGLAPELAQRCKDLFLLAEPAANRRGSEPASGPAHDALAPLVRARFDEPDAPGQRARRILEIQAVEWRDGKEDADAEQVQRGADSCGRRQRTRSSRTTWMLTA